MSEAGLAFAASHSTTPGGQQDPRATTKEARASANSATHGVGGGVCKGTSPTARVYQVLHLGPILPAGFYSPYLAVFGLALPLNGLQDIKRNPGIFSQTALTLITRTLLNTGTACSCPSQGCGRRRVPLPFRVDTAVCWDPHRGRGRSVDQVLGLDAMSTALPFRRSHR